MADPHDPVPLDFTEVPPDEMQERACAFCEQMSQRRSMRAFSDRPVPQALIEEAIRTAGTAPSGAHRQPWQFVAVDDPTLKAEIREAVEEEEKEFYENRVTEEWKEALAPLGTDWRKPYLETAAVQGSGTNVRVPVGGIAFHSHTPCHKPSPRRNDGSAGVIPFD
jgi:nitroreductase